MIDLSKIMLGTLVVNKQMEIERVKSMTYSSIRKGKNSFGPEFEGEINGKPVSQYDQLPVTVSLLSALGWKIEDDKEKNLVSAWPPADQFEDITSADDFKVQFILADEAVAGWLSGNVITPNGCGDWVEVIDFVELEHFFMEQYAHRMYIAFITDGYKIPI